MNKLVTIAVTLISLIGIFLFVRVSGVDNENVSELTAAVSPLVTYSLVLLGLTAFVAVIASLLGVLKNPAALKKALLGIVGLGVVLLIAYLVADSNKVINANKEVIAATGSSVSKLTSTGIWASIILVLVAAAFFIWDLLKGLIKS